MDTDEPSAAKPQPHGEHPSPGLRPPSPLVGRGERAGVGSARLGSWSVSGSERNKRLSMNRRWNAAFRRQIATRAWAVGCRLKAAFRFTGARRGRNVREILSMNRGMVAQASRRRVCRASRSAALLAAVRRWNSQPGTAALQGSRPHCAVEKPWGGARLSQAQQRATCQLGSGLLGGPSCRRGWPRLGQPRPRSWSRCAIRESWQPSTRSTLEAEGLLRVGTTRAPVGGGPRPSFNHVTMQPI